jgi:uncharacterized protein (TIGR03083 family)
VSARFDAFRTSVNRLRDVVAPLDDETIVRSAYPAEWTIAQVMSHVGSAAVILGRRLDDQRAGHDTPEDAAPAVWDEWNAKTPRAQVDDGLAADAAYLQRLEAMSDQDRQELSFTIGPLRLDFDQLAGVRLNEHAVHSWDIEVALDPSATIPPAIAALIVDNLDLIARYTSKPGGDPSQITVRTSEPERHFTVELAPDSVSLIPSAGEAGAGAPHLELPAEAFVRLVYGRLDPEHTPPSVGDPALLQRLRGTFPGP